MLLTFLSYDDLAICRILWTNAIIPEDSPTPPTGTKPTDSHGPILVLYIIQKFTQAILNPRVYLHSTSYIS